MPALVKRIEVGSEDRVELERVVRSSTAEVRMVERAQIVLYAAEGRSAAEIGAMVGCSTNTVQKWRSRYERDGIAGLGDLPRSGKPLIYSQVDRARLIAKACTRPPETPQGAQQERWTYEQLGAAVGMSASHAHVILSRADIKPHLTDYWMMTDFSQPEFEERCKEVCGLYVNPPENVLVVSIDEKTGIYLPEDWCEDPVRRRKAKIPDHVGFQTKPELGVALIEHASTFQIDRAPVLGDAAYGDNTRLRSALHAQGIDYVLSIKAETTIFGPDTVFAVPERAPGSKGPAPSAPRAEEEAISAEQFARSLNPEDFHTVTFRGKGKTRVRSRFAFCRITAAHPVTRDSQAPRQEWLIVEWPEGRDAPSDYWISNLPAHSKPGRLARLARLRWMIELDYRQLKGELGLDHYEGRSYLGWYHHTALVTAAHGFLTLERQDPKARRRRASRSPKRSACWSPSSTAGQDTATPASSR